MLDMVFLFLHIENKDKLDQVWIYLEMGGVGEGGLEQTPQNYSIMIFNICVPKYKTLLEKIQFAVNKKQKVWQLLTPLYICIVKKNLFILLERWIDYQDQRKDSLNAY